PLRNRLRRGWRADRRSRAALTRAERTHATRRRSDEAAAGDLAQLGAVVRRPHGAHRARARPHDQRLGRRLPPGEVANALQELAVGDAGGGEEDVLTRDEAVDVEYLVEVVAGRDRFVALAIVARPETAEDRPPQALDRRGGDHAL